MQFNFEQLLINHHLHYFEKNPPKMLGGFFSLPFGEKVVSLPRKSNNRRTMSEATLKGLLDYLYNTLTPDNMRWMAMNLMAYADADEENLKPYTMDELNAMLDEAERNYKAGLGIPSKDVFRELEEEFEQEELQLEMA